MGRQHHLDGVRRKSSHGSLSTAPQQTLSPRRKLFETTNTAVNNEAPVVAVEEEVVRRSPRFATLQSSVEASPSSKVEEDLEHNVFAATSAAGSSSALRSTTKGTSNASSPSKLEMLISKFSSQKNTESIPQRKIDDTLLKKKGDTVLKKIENISQRYAESISQKDTRSTQPIVRTENTHNTSKDDQSVISIDTNTSNTNNLPKTTTPPEPPASPLSRLSPRRNSSIPTPLRGSSKLRQDITADVQSDLQKNAPAVDRISFGRPATRSITKQKQQQQVPVLSDLSDEEMNANDSNVSNFNEIYDAVFTSTVKSQPHSHSHTNGLSKVNVQSFESDDEILSDADTDELGSQPDIDINTSTNIHYSNNEYPRQSSSIAAHSVYRKLNHLTRDTHKVERNNDNVIRHTRKSQQSYSAPGSRSATPNKSTATVSSVRRLAQHKEDWKRRRAMQEYITQLSHKPDNMSMPYITFCFLLFVIMATCIAHTLRFNVMPWEIASPAEFVNNVILMAHEIKILLHK